MKALSIRQPWAWLVVNGWKDIENRGWSTGYRGEFLVHAGKTFDEDFNFDWAAEIMAKDVGIREGGPLAGDLMPIDPEDYELGGIVGKARIVDCVRSHKSPWFFGPCGFVLTNAEPLDFRPCRGALNFFDPEALPKAGIRSPKASPQGDLFE